jgi:TetR/AcrR family transcriptional regulator
VDPDSEDQTTSTPSDSATPRSRSARTRAALLAAAEEIFAERGFAATRLEDVAHRVGIRRASIVYYFKDKEALYEAVLDQVLGGLFQVIEPVLSGPGPPGDRIEAAVSTWVDYVGQRPSLARILLREVADAAPDRHPALLRYLEPFRNLVRQQIVGRDDFDASKLAPIDPLHMASTVIGATVFLVAAMPILVPHRATSPMSSEQLLAHRDEMVRIVRRLLTARPVDE